MPVLKLAANSTLAARKKQWIDFNAGALEENKSMDECDGELFETVLNIASGTVRTKNEINDYRDMAIFKNGVTL